MIIPNIWENRSHVPNQQPSLHPKGGMESTSVAWANHQWLKGPKKAPPPVQQLAEAPDFWLPAFGAEDDKVSTMESDGNRGSVHIIMFLLMFYVISAFSFNASYIYIYNIYIYTHIIYSSTSVLDVSIPGSPEIGKTTKTPQLLQRNLQASDMAKLGFKH